MDPAAAKETADIYLKSKGENNSAPLLRALAASARNTGQKTDPSKKNHYSGETLWSRKAPLKNGGALTTPEKTQKLFFFHY